MRLDSDVVLIGTGVAPLIAAHEFIQNGKSVVLLNPDYDYFSENSELPYDPLWPISGKNFSFDRIKKAAFDEVFESVRAGYPGSVEVWPNSKGGFQNELAPFIRSRARLWMRSLND
jgi:glycine/D-amino acid oxidase-like deaminating enzyme